MKTMKKIALILAMAALISVFFAICVSADDTAGETVPAGAICSVTHADGTVTYLFDSTEFRYAVNDAADGDRFKLLSDIKINRGMSVSSTEDSPKTFYFDFAGHAVYSFVKIEMFGVKDYTTAYFYSSAPGAYAYINTNEDKSDLANQSGCIFSISGARAFINVGDFADGDNFYPGANLSTFSSAFVNNPDTYISGTTLNPSRAHDGTTFTVNGGNYFSVIADYTGFVIARGGDIVINLNEANFLFDNGTYPIHSHDENTVINANKCNFISITSTTKPMFNDLLGKVNLTDCVSNYPVKANGAGGKNLSILGNTYLGYSSDFNMNLVVRAEDDERVLVPARVTVTPELAQGGTTTWFYPDASMTNRYDFVIPRVAGAVLAEVDNTFDCRWIYKDTIIDEIWLNGQAFSAPFEIEGEDAPGLYKYGWKKTVDEQTGLTTFEGGKILDFNIKVSARMLYGSAYIKVHIPFDMVDNGYFSVSNTKINGVTSTRNDWKEVEVDGVMYYCAEIYVDPEDINDDVNLVLACNFNDEIVDTPWSISVKEYIEAVLATEADGVYTAAEYQYVKNMKSELFPETENTAAAPALIPSNKKYA